MSAPKALVALFPCPAVRPTTLAGRLWSLLLWLACLFAISAKPAEPPASASLVAQRLRLERLQAAQQPHHDARIGGPLNAHLAYWRAQEHLRRGEVDQALEHYAEALVGDERYIHDPTLAHDLLQALLAPTPAPSERAIRLLAAYPSAPLQQRLVRLAADHPESHLRRRAWQALALAPERLGEAPIHVQLLALELADSCDALRATSAQLLSQAATELPIDALRQLRDHRPRDCHTGPAPSLGACLPCWKGQLEDAMRRLEAPAGETNAQGLAQTPGLDTPKVQD